MAKFHISEDGVPRSCTAADGNCPLGGESEHFTTKIQARAAFEARQDAVTIAPTLQKKKTREELREAFVSSPIEYETPEPARQYERVLTQVTAGQIKKGDLYIHDDGETGEVLESKTGTKNTTLKVAKGDKVKTVILPATEALSVKRNEETEASKEAFRVYYVESALERQLKNYEPQRAKALADLNVYVQRGWRGLSHQTRNFIEAEAKDQVMSIYEEHVEGVKRAIEEKRPGFEGVTTPYTKAFELTKKEFTEEIIREARRGENRSTSQLSNDIENVLIAAKSDFIDNIRYY